MVINSSLRQSFSINDYSLKSTRVDLWHFPLHHQPTAVGSLLNSEECERADRFYFPKHQRRFAVTRAMLRCILSKYLLQAPELFNFTSNHYGKPYVSNSAQLQFNVSHSSDWALIAVGKGHELGVDLEFHSVRPYLDLAKNLFSAYEIETLSVLTGKSLAESFFIIWSQKEAFIKACGMGLSYPTDKIDMATSLLEVIITDPLTQQDWRVIPFIPQVNCAAALCLHPSIEELRFRQLDNLNEFF